MLDMTNIIVNGHKIRVAVMNSGMTREKVVVLVQDLVKADGLTFSLAGLDKLIKGIVPKNDPEMIIEALAKVLKLEASDFAEFEAQTAS